MFSSSNTLHYDVTERKQHLSETYSTVRKRAKKKGKHLLETTCFNKCYAITLFPNPMFGQKCVFYKISFTQMFGPKFVFIGVWHSDYFFVSDHVYTYCQQDLTLSTHHLNKQNSNSYIYESLE